MMKINPDASSMMAKTNPTAGAAKINQAGKTKQSDNTLQTFKKYISDAQEFQHMADTSVKDLLTGKNEDLMSVVSAVSKADMSFKLLVGVRNKLIDAYKQTMNMQI